MLRSSPWIWWVTALAGLLGLLYGVVHLFSDEHSVHEIPEVAWTAPVSIASGNAHRGPWRMNDSDWDFVDDPSVALSDNGTAGVVWADHTEQDLFYQAVRQNGERTPSSPVNVSQTPDTFSWLPRIVFPEKTGETIYVAWQEIIFSGGTHGGDILFARSEDGGHHFRAPVNLSQSKTGAGKGRLSSQYWHNGSLDLALGPDGNVFVTWTEYEGRLWLRRSTDGGRTFSEPVHVAGDQSSPARGPSLTIGSSGTVHLAWAVGEDPAADIHYVQSTEDWDAFGRPKLVANSDGHSDGPSTALDSEGTLHLVYGESSSGAFREYDIRYVQGSTPDTFSAPRTIASANTSPSESVHFPTLRVGPKNTVYACWELFPDAQGRPRGIGYTVSSDGGTTFGSPSVVPNTNVPSRGFSGSQQGLLMEKLAVNAAGEVALVNSTFDEGEESHIWLYRGQTTGVP